MSTDTFIDVVMALFIVLAGAGAIVAAALTALGFITGWWLGG
jgi:hypothetical protein